MSSLIEQAALRLEQLRQAGVTVPEMDPVAGLTAVEPSARAQTDGALPPPGSASPFAQAPGAPREAHPISKMIQLDLDAIAAASVAKSN